MKKFLSVTALLMAALLIALCCVACGDDKKEENGQTAAAEAETDTGIVGTWHYTMEYEKVMVNSDYLSQLSGAQKEYAEILLGVYDGVSSTVVMEINADETYSLYTDKASVESALDQLKANFKEVFPDLIAASGYDMSTFESELEAQGYTMDAYIDTMFSQMNLNSITEGVLSSGKYRFDGEKFYPSDDSGAIDESHYLIIDISGNTLTITDAVGLNDSGSMFASQAFPIEFTRA